MITLAPLDRKDTGRVAHIAARPDQFRFAGTVAEALTEPPERFDLHEIRKDETPVGIFKIDRAYGCSYPFAGPLDLGLRAVIVDAAMQGKGVGKAAMSALRRYLADRYPEFASVMLTVNLANPAALAVYRATGFEDTGEIWPHGDAGPQHIMRLGLRAGE